MLEKETIDNIAQVFVDSMSYKNADGTYNKLRSSNSNIDIEDYKRSDNVGYKVANDINELFKLAINMGASDIHMSVGAPPKYRITNELKPIPDYAILTPEEIERLLRPLITPEQMRQFEMDGDLDFAYSSKGVGRFRCNLYKQRGTWAGVFRTLSDKIPSFDELGLPQVIRNVVDKKRGLVLVTGPTGSGKSTTLASIISTINNKYKKNIITLEDPIEYLHAHKLSNVNQREIGLDSKNFASGLRAALREDPDVILVGEMRDYETISTAVTAAETGHLVLSTLHTIGATNTIDRILDTYPPQQQGQARSQLASVIEAIISQQLIPKKDNSGRVAAFEIMTGNTAVRNIIREGKTEQLTSVIQSGRSEGMILLDESLMSLVKSGVISMDMALSFAASPKTFRERETSYQQNPTRFSNGLITGRR